MAALIWFMSHPGIRTNILCHGVSRRNMGVPTLIANNSSCCTVYDSVVHTSRCFLAFPTSSSLSLSNKHMKWSMLCLASRISWWFLYCYKLLKANPCWSPPPNNGYQAYPVTQFICTIKPSRVRSPPSNNGYPAYRVTPVYMYNKAKQG